MARRPPAMSDVPEHIVDVDVSSEMRNSFLEYAYSVIYARALPDARDGLKPVQRRILFQMAQMNLRPDRGHVKSARVVGDVMGRLHPHGDSAIYDALVRMAQPFAMRLPMVDGQGNFGDLDSGPAAMRYTEARLALPAMRMTDSLDEDVIDFRPNYDGREIEPDVLPAALPNLLVNGAAGIAVGMATNMAPHNLGEVVAAARHLLAKPDATLDDLMRFVPGPDLPTGGRIVGLEGIREAYATGRGSFRVRATAKIEQGLRGKHTITVTELPYNVGPERVIERVKDLIDSKKIQGLAGKPDDLTDMDTAGLQLVFDVKAGFNPEMILEQLYKLTPMEDSFSINAVALVEGRPRTLGLKELLEVFLGHRVDVTKRRTRFRLGKANDRLHLVEGLLIAVLNIDEVIAVIRSSDDVAMARERLISIFDLTELQANHILDMPLRRLTRFSQLELEKERDELRRTIEFLEAILASDESLKKVVSDELAAVAAELGTPRRTVLLAEAAIPVFSTATAAATAEIELPDSPTWVLLSSTGQLARTSDTEPPSSEGPRGSHDVVVSSAPTTTRGDVLLVTDRGRAVRTSVIDLPSLPTTNGAPSLAGGVPVSELASLESGERVIAVIPARTDGPGVALGTATGVVKRVRPDDVPSRSDSWSLIALEPGDSVVGAAWLPTGDESLVFVTSDAQLLHFPAASVRPQGRSAGGMAGVKLAGGQNAVAFTAVNPSDDKALVVTIAGSTAALPGTVPGSAKVTPLTQYPAKGRATGGVRVQKLRSGEDCLIYAWVGLGPARASSATGQPVDLPELDMRRDSTGVPPSGAVAAIGGAAATTWV
jgi:DNA gyrase subunit A